MKKKTLLFVIVLAMALPLAAFADDVSFTSTGGTFTGNSQGYILTNATLTQITGLDGNSYSGSNLGTVSFNTGTLGSISNVIVGGPVLPGGSITITGNGSNGIPTGTLFTGTFNQGGTWGYQIQSDGSYLYTLNAQVSGQTIGGNSAVGTMSFNIDMTGIFPGHTSASGTDTVSLAVPEPGELSLMGMGLLGLVGAIRRKVTC